MWVYYLLMLIAVTLLAASNCFTKQYQKITENYNNIECSFRKTIPMCVISLVFFLCLNGFKIEFSVFSFLMAIALAVVNVVAQIIIFKAYEKGRVALFTMFQMQGGMILPFIYGVVFADNQLSPFKIIGIVLMIGSLVLPHIKSGEGLGKNALFVFLCVLIFFLNGSISIFSYVHSNSPLATGNNSFLFFLYGFIAIMTAVVYAVFCLKNKSNMFTVKPSFSQKERLLLWGFVFASAMASAVSYLLQLTSAGHLPAVTAYPLITGGTVVLMGIAGRLFFKEKLGLKSVISIIATFIATLLFMF